MEGKKSEILQRLLWFFRTEVPEETMCEHCGRFSPYYYIECPYCYDGEPDIIGGMEGDDVGAS